MKTVYTRLLIHGINYFVQIGSKLILVKCLCLWPRDNFLWPKKHLFTRHLFETKWNYSSSIFSLNLGLTFIYLKDNTAQVTFLKWVPTHHFCLRQSRPVFKSNMQRYCHGWGHEGGIKITEAVAPQVLCFYLHNPSWHSMRKNSELFKAFVRKIKKKQ